MKAGLALMLGSTAAVLVAAAQPAHHHPAPAAAAAPAAATEAQVQRLRAAIARYSDFEVARREGWKKFGGKGSARGR